jgi:hypothetical protein
MLRLTDQQVALLWWQYRQRFLEAKRLAFEDTAHAEIEPPETGRRLFKRSEAKLSDTYLNLIPRDDRAIFEVFYDGKLRERLRAAGEHGDPDAVEAQLIADLIAQAEGDCDAHVPGFVPDVGGSWHELEHPLPDRDPRAHVVPAGLLGRFGARGVRRWLAALAVLVVGLGYRPVVQNLQSVLIFLPLAYDPHYLLVTLGAMLAFGLLLGTLGSYLGVRRFLRS